MDADTIIAGAAALISSIAALVAIWNAKSASKQVDLAEEQADAAKIQAEEAKRSADAAWSQLDHSKHEYRMSMVERQREAFETLVKRAWDFHWFVPKYMGKDGYKGTEGALELVEKVPCRDPSFKVLIGTLSYHPLLLALKDLSEEGVELMGNTLAMLVIASMDKPDSANEEEFRRQANDRWEKFPDIIKNFELAGGDYLHKELRRLSGKLDREWGAPNQNQ